MFEQYEVLTAVNIARRLKVTKSPWSRNPRAAPACRWLKESSQSISFNWPFPYIFFHTVLFWPLSREGSWGHLVSVSVEVLALYRCCTAAHHFYVTAQASKRPLTVLPAGLMENSLLLCCIHETPRFLWNCGVFCTVDYHRYQSCLY